MNKSKVITVLHVAHLRGQAVALDARHEEIDRKVFVVVIPIEGWACVAVPILLLV